MKKTFKKTLIIILITLLFLVLFWTFYLRNLEVNKLKKEGLLISQQIESYYTKNGSLPNSLTDLGIYESESDRIFYRKISDKDYAVDFSIGFDDMYGFYSDTQEWERGYR